MALRTLRGMIDGDKAEATEQLAFVACSKGQRFFTGDDIRFLDIVLGSYVGWFRAAERITAQRVLDEKRMPWLAACAARFCVHEAIRDVMPGAGRLVEFGEALRTTLAANAQRM